MFARTCSFEGCKNKHRAKGLCSSHLWQRDNGKPLTPLRGPHGREYERCTFEGCDKPHASNGLCTGHRSQVQRGQPLKQLGEPHRGFPSQGKTRWVDPKGYVFVRGPPGHPNAKARKSGWIAAHVLVMSEVIGRPLRKGESVHHKNNIKHDNRPENLELWATHQPYGARVQDLVDWARWLLKEYGETFPEEHMSPIEMGGCGP